MKFTYKISEHKRLHLSIAQPRNTQNVMQGTESKTITEIGAFVLFSILLEPGGQVRDLVETQEHTW